MSQFLDIFNHRIKEEKKTFVVTGNPEIVVLANEDPQYMEAIKKADFIVPDGIGIIKASHILKRPLKERVAGFDLMRELLKLAEKEQYTVYLLGAKDETLNKAVRNIKHAFPQIQIVGWHHGYFDLSDESIVHQVLQSDADLIFVGTGFPKQEFWIEQHLGKFRKGFFMGVGGSFDVWAGDVKRAPQFWIDHNLEWLYRLIQQPSRIKRMFALPKFLFWILREKEGTMGNMMVENSNFDPLIL